MYILVNRVALYYTRRGRGPAILLLHGNGEDHTLYQDLMGTLAADGYSVYALDSRNHGESQGDLSLSYQALADDTEAFITQLELQPVTIIGFSDGAITAMLVASRHPNLVARLVLAGGNLTPKGLKWYSRWATRLSYWKTKDTKLKMMLEEPQIDSRQLERIKAPTLVLAGARDLIRAVETARIARHIKNARLKIVPNASHSSYVTNNQQFYHLVGPFLAATRPS